MTFNDFRRLVLLFGAAIIITTALMVLISYRNPEDAAGQILFSVILLGAAFYGRQGGLVSAIVASVLYLVVLVPVMFSRGVVGSLPTLGFHGLIYFLSGYIGGEIFMRVKYLLASLEGNDLIDHESRLYRQAHFRHLIRKKMEEYERYESVFALINIVVDNKTLADLPEERRIKTLRQLGGAIKGDIRLTDDAGRLNENTISALLPHTPAAGAVTCAKRLYMKATRVLGGEDHLVYEVLAYPDSRDKIEKLVGKPSDAWKT